MLTWLLLSTALGADARLDRPHQVQLGLMGPTVKLLGGALAPPKAERVEVIGAFFLPSLAGGMHLTEWFYVGGAIHPGFHRVLHTPWGVGEVDDLDLVVDHQPGAILRGEARFTIPVDLGPVPLGAFLSLGPGLALSTPYVAHGTARGEPAQIGDQQAVDVVAGFDTPLAVRPAVGGGWAHTYANGFCFTLGGGWLIAPGKATNFEFPSNFSPAARTAMTEALRAERFYSPFWLNVDFGFAW